MEEGASIWSQLVSMMERRLGRVGPFVITTVFVLAALAVALLCLRYIIGFVVDVVAPWVGELNWPDVGEAAAFVLAFVAIVAVTGLMGFLTAGITNARAQEVRRAQAHRDVSRVLDEGPDGRKKLILAILTSVMENEDTPGERPYPEVPGYTTWQIAHDAELCKRAGLVQRQGRGKNLRLWLSVEGEEAMARLQDWG